MEGGEGEAGREEAFTVDQATCPVIDSAPSDGIRGKAWCTVRNFKGWVGSATSDGAQLVQDAVLKGPVRDDGSSLTCWCRHLIQQRMQSPMKARKLKVPPNTTARNIGWFWFNPLDKTERERREGRGEVFGWGYSTGGGRP